MNEIYFCDLGLRKCHFASHVINQMILHDSGSRMCLTEAMEIIQRST